MQTDLQQQLEQRTRINNFLMRAALPIGLYFIFEYMLTVWSAGNIFMGMLRLPFLLGTPILLYISMRKLRDNVMGGTIGWFRAWLFGLQMMLFAALVEAAWIYLYNEFIAPENLYEMQSAAIAQYEESAAMLAQSSQMQSVLRPFNEAVETLKEAPVPTAIEAAVQMVSNDLFIGILLMIPISLLIQRKTNTTE